MKVPENFEMYYPDSVVLMLDKDIYGTKQAAMQFWKELLKCMKNKLFKRSPADTCVYFKLTAMVLILWLSRISNCMIWAKKKRMIKDKKEFMKWFECEAIGDINEYVGCKFEQNYEEKSIVFTKPVMLQSFGDEFKFPTERKSFNPGKPGSKLMKAEPEQVVKREKYTHLRGGVGKLLHMAGWSTPDVPNVARELSRQNSAPTEVHIKSLHRCMEYCLETPTRGWHFKPERSWGEKNRVLNSKSRESQILIM